MKNLVIDYEKLLESQKTAPKDLLKVFTRAGAEIASSWVGKAKREAGVSFKPVTLVFADSQEVELRVKQTGDIYQVRMNGKVQPVKEQDDQKKAIAEIVGMVEGNAKRFQAALLRRKVKLPKGIKSTVKRKEEVYTARKSELQAQIADADAEISRLEKELATIQGA